MEPLYRDLTSGHELVESQLGESFAEYLNAEIALRNIVDLEGAKRWLSGTYLFVRVRASSSSPHAGICLRESGCLYSASRRACSHW